MRLSLGALLLNIIILSTEIKASDNPKKNPNLGRIITKTDKNLIDYVGTSRLPTSSAPRRDSNSLEREALDLHRPQPTVSGTSKKTRSKEVLDLKNKIKEKHEHPSHRVSSTRTIQNDPIGTRGHESMHTHVPLDNVRWLIEHFRNEASSVPAKPEPQKRNPHTREAKELKAKEREADKIYSLSLREHSELIQRELHQGDPQLNGRVVYREDDAVRQYENHFPRGLPYPLPPPFSPSLNINLPPVLHDRDHPITPAEYRRRAKNKRQDPTQNNAPGYHGQYSQDRQVSEHASQESRS